MGAAHRKEAEQLCRRGGLGGLSESLACTGVQQDDGSRLAQLRCHTAKEGHTYRKFTWGNRKSLVELPASQGIDVRSALVQYYK